MKRNVIFMHLESLNYVNYHMNQHMFPNLSRYEQMSLSFDRYFSTATSTLMVLADLVYGGMLQYEVCDSLDDIPVDYCYKKSLFDCLGEQGYKTEVLYYPGGIDCESAEKRHVVGFQCHMTSLSKYDEYMMEIEQALDGNRPFALLLCNTVSNIALNYNIPGDKSESGLDRWKQGYLFMDHCIKNIMDLLEARNLLDSTTIIFYGDHGDDYYAHGIHQGLTHAVEPYGNLIHTPFWIYDSRLKKIGRRSDLICTTDIRMVVKNLLELPESPFVWEDLDSLRRSYAIARNAYARQPVRQDSFNKGYSLTDGRFLLLVNGGGLAFYDIEMDPGCHNNLLRFFIYEGGILHLNEELHNYLKYHYVHLVNMGTIQQIRQTVYYYKNKLYEETLALFQYAECTDRIKELRFDKIQIQI